MTEDEPAPPPPALPPDPDAYDSPRAVQARARGLAAPYIPGGEDPDPEGTRRRERHYLRWLIAMTVVIVLSGFILGAIAKLVDDALPGGSQAPTTGVTSTAGLTYEPASPAPTGGARATVAPSAPPVLGSLEDGIPTTLDGVAVVHGGDVLDAGASSADASPLLLGGWFHAVSNGRFCTFFRPPRPVDSCAGGFDLFVGSSTKLGVTLAPGTDEKQTVELATTTIRPVVLRVHTHDPLCVGQFKYCRSTLVLNEIAWLGASLAELPPAPVEAPPSTPFSRHDALTKARRKLGAAYELRSVKVVRETTAEGVVLGPVAEDPWVWWLRYRIPGTGSTAYFVFDYLTGKELGAGKGYRL